MMKMDGRDSVECQNWEKNGKIVILELFKLEKDEERIVFISLNKRPKENVKCRE